MTYITKKLKNIVIAILMTVAVVGNVAGVSAATFNTASGDTTLKVSNYTQHPGSSAHWASNATANENEVLSFLISYHNTSSEKACDVRIKLNLPSTISNGQTISATVWADSTTPVTGTVTVYTNFSGSRNISQVTGTDSVRWYAGPSSAKMTLPFSQSGTELLSSEGLRIGNIHPDNSGYIVARAQIGTGGGQVGQAPTAITRSATNVGKTSATLQGSGDPNNASTDAWFEYGTSSSLGNTTSSTSLGSGDSERDYSIYVSGLSANTTYYYRAVTRNAHGTAYGSILSFCTDQNNDQGYAPYVTTQAASNVTQTSATLNATVDPNNSYTDAWFEYGTSTSLGNTTNSQNVGSGDYATSIQKNISNLNTSTTYYYRAVARNSYGTTYGNIVSFVTGQGYQQGNAPYVTTQAATNVTQTSGTMNGTVNPNGYSTSVWFEYGQTTSLGTTSAAYTIGSGNAVLSRYQNLSGLASNVTYYYRIVAQNQYGTTYGNIVSFSTGTSNYSNVNDILNSLITRLAYLSSSITNIRSTEKTVYTTVQGEQVIFTLTPDKEKAKPGEVVTLTAEIRTTSALENAKLSLTLDDMMDCENICGTFPIANFTKQGRTFVFDLGTIPANSVQSYPFKVTISENANEGDMTTATGALSYGKTDADQKTLTDSATVEVSESNGFLASISSMFGGVAGSIIPLLVAILIAIGLVFIARKVIELVS